MYVTWKMLHSETQDWDLKLKLSQVKSSKFQVRLEFSLKSLCSLAIWQLQTFETSQFEQNWQNLVSTRKQTKPGLTYTNLCFSEIGL